MTETLWAVIIGGSIGLVGGVATTILSLSANYYRWKKEKKLEHLRTERRHFEEVCKNILTKLPESLDKNIAPHDMMADILMFIPKDVFETLQAAIEEYSCKPDEITKILIAITAAMKEARAEIDGKISKLLS